MYYEFKIGWCPFCNQGWAEIWKDSITTDFEIMCSECFTIWDSPEAFLKNISRVNFEGNRVIRPTYEEIEIKGWTKYIDRS